MRHRKRTVKLGRTSEHRNLMLANLVCSLIEHRRVTTTLAKARAARSLAEKMVTLGKSGTLHDRRLAAARLHREEAVRILFNDIAPTQNERRGGYTRIVKLRQRVGDAASVVLLEWVDEALAPKIEAATEKETPASKEPVASESSGTAPASGESASKAPARGDSSSPAGS